MHHLTRFVLVVGAVCTALFVGCATEEIPQYGDPAKVIGGVGATGSGAGSSSSGSGSSSSSGMCMPDAGCMVSFKNDVFPILEMKAKCSDAACHAPGANHVPVMTPGDSAATLQSLLMHPFQEDPNSPYISPCNVTASKIICNMKLDTGNNTNPYVPQDCLPRMPKVQSDAVDDAPLSVTDLNKIAEWISCGAPDN